MTKVAIRAGIRAPKTFQAPDIEGELPVELRVNQKYTPELANTICLRIMEMQTLDKICQDPRMPSKRTLIKWLADPSRADFREMYYYARRVQAEMYVDQAMDIANDTDNDWQQTFNKKGEPNGWKPNNEAIQRSKLKIDTIKWNAAKMMPRIYGEHLDVTHDVTGDLAELLKGASNQTVGLPEPINGKSRPD